MTTPHPYFASIYHDGNRWVLRAVKRPRPGLCNAAFCVRPPAAKSRYCSRCKTRVWRLNNPLRATYGWLKDRAARRGQPFTVTLDDLRTLPGMSDYLAQRIKAPNSLHIDRKDPLRGYEPGNLQIVTTRENTAKAANDKRLHEAARLAEAGQSDFDYELDEDLCPF